MTEVLRLDWLTDTDIFAMRQRGRSLAAAVGLDGLDQIRVATALSEIGRDVLGHQRTTAVFRVMQTPARLSITITASGRLAVAEEADARTGVAAARRLLDDVRIEADGEDAIVTLVKLLPRGAAIGRSDLARLRESLTAIRATTPMEELRAQNADLVRALDQLAQRQQELVRLNAELVETNRGVVAMYTELSGELQETNRGVVALYAELDEKGRQLASANESKTRFLRSVSHELRAPVNAILGLADLLNDGSLDAEQREQVTYLRGSARALLGLVNELLDLARAESGQLDVQVGDVDLASVFSDLRGTLRPMTTGRHVDLVVCEPEVAFLRTDGGLLARVLRNLLTNALSFTESGQVCLRAVGRASGQHVEISVTDTGVGIAPENQDKIFEEFFQVPGPLQAKRSGTGLGLPYARRVIEALGGTLSLTSAPGRGSTFTVVLPLAPVAESGDTADIVIGHVLLVDDDAAFRHVIRGMLQGVASRVSEAADGAEALSMARALGPDLMLLDLRMPNVDGAQVIAALRADPESRLRGLPVVLLTSVDTDAEVRRAVGESEMMLAKSGLRRAGLLRALRLAVGADTRSEERT